MITTKEMIFDRRAPIPIPGKKKKLGLGVGEIYDTIVRYGC
jgi:hypothetical protein